MLRYCFASANVWAEVLAKFMFVWVATFGSSIAIRRNAHLRVDLLIDYLRPKYRYIIQILTYPLILLFLIYLCKLGMDLMDRTWVNKSAGLRLPMAIPYSAIPVGGVFMILSCIEFIGKRVEALMNLGKPGQPDGRQGEKI